MANTTKVTKREVINMMLNEEVIQANEVYVNYLTHELELLNNKTGSRKPTKTQVENEDIKKIILEVLTDKGVTISELIKSDARLANYTNQKISALMRPMIADGLVVKKTEKKTSYFSLASVGVTEPTE